ncbi:transcriptional regulator [Methanothermobacter sp.]|uniref:transcriptional regulator n=1 Tax=Methanothermobacter sp. TaxID=1884223 RepID=UPI00260BE475|nr:transcriptional regulator [Methanothermobacter sp.]MDI9619014.1 transcriptional regulator [Methanothermobacter sp.]
MIGKKTLSDEKLALITFSGSLSKTGELIEEVREFISSENLEIAGDPLVIFYTSPLKDDGRYDVGIPVKGESEGSGDIKIVTIPEHTVIFKEYSENRNEAYEELIAYTEENGIDIIGAPREICHKKVREIQFPVIL